MTANALTNVEGKWIGDGGEGDIQQEGPSLTLTSAKPGTPLNVRYDDISLEGDWCFEVILVRITKGSSISVGIVNPGEMQAGWKTRGMFYNGNLTNGSAALIVNFGPYLKEGDTVGVMVTNNNKEVTFFHDGQCLGMGFSLPDSKMFCPCLHASGTVQISFNIPETLPAVQSREKSEGLMGDWKLVEAVNESGSSVPILEGHELIMTLHKGSHDKEVDVSMHVGNILRTHLTMVDEGGTVKAGMVMSTMMEPPPELREIETFLSASLGKIVAMSQDGETLVLSNGELKLVFARHVKKFQPLTKYSN